MTANFADPAESFAAVAAAHAAREAEMPPIPSQEDVLRRKIEVAGTLVTELAAYVQHRADCLKDTSPSAVVSGKVVGCSCGLAGWLRAAAAFVRTADLSVDAREVLAPQPAPGTGDADCG